MTCRIAGSVRHEKRAAVPIAVSVGSLCHRYSLSVWSYGIAVSRAGRLCREAAMRAQRLGPMGERLSMQTRFGARQPEPLCRSQHWRTRGRFGRCHASRNDAARSRWLSSHRPAPVRVPFPTRRLRRACRSFCSVRAWQESKSQRRTRGDGATSPEP